MRTPRIALTVLLTLLSAAVLSAQPLPEHGLHYGDPALTWDEGFPLGNGLLGALVWGDGRPLNISLDRTDLWDLRPVPEFHTDAYSYRTMRDWVEQGRHDDLVRLYERPYSIHPGPTKIPAGRILLEAEGGRGFTKGSLDLATAKAQVELTGGIGVEVFVHAVDPVGVIRVRRERPLDVSAVLLAPSFGGTPANPDPQAMSDLELAHLGYPPPVESRGDDWMGYVQEGWGGFSFAVGLVWRRSGEEWLGAWSVQTNEAGVEPLDEALRLARHALDRGMGNVEASHLRWWDRYWSRSDVSLPNGVIERQWYLEMYKFGAAARRDAPPITLQGPWTADNGSIPPWRGDYHHDLNTQLSYWPAYAGNQLDGGEGFVEWLWDTRDHSQAWTARFFELPGLNVPMTADLNNEQMGGWHPYTHSATTAAWLAHHFYLHWRYSMDEAFLRSRAYPWLRETAVFLEAVTEVGPDGKRTLPLSSSPEINDNRLDAWFEPITNYDLALIRWTFEKAAELARLVGETAEAHRWKQRLAEMPALARGPEGDLLVAPGYPLAESHRHFSHLMAFHPLGLVDRSNGYEDAQTIAASLERLRKLGTDYWTGYSFSWLANMYARAEDGEAAARALEIFATAFCLRNSFHVNGDQSGQGYSRFTYRPFTLEGNFAAAAAVHEMLLQSHTGALRLFPAVPDDWADVSFRTLRAEGAFLVSAERVGGRTVRVDVLAEQGGPLRLEQPFGTRPYRIESETPPREEHAGLLVFDTRPGSRIVLMAE